MSLLVQKQLLSTDKYTESLFSGTAISNEDTTCSGVSTNLFSWPPLTQISTICCFNKVSSQKYISIQFSYTSNFQFRFHRVKYQACLNQSSSTFIALFKLYHSISIKNLKHLGEKIYFSVIISFNEEESSITSVTRIF